MRLVRASEPRSSPTPAAPPPLWVRAADLVCLALVVVAVIVAMSGGFRLRLGPIRFALTSPYRLLFWAIAIGVVRHVASPAVPIYRHLPHRLDEWRRRPGVRASFSALAATRPAILLVGYLAVVMIGPLDGVTPLRAEHNELLNLPARWDAGWYLDVVVKGYIFDATKPDEQQNIAFMPAYPLLVRAVGRLFGGLTASYLASGMLVSLLAFFGALVYLYALARDTLDDEGARHVLWLVAAYPFAVFFGAIYTESLFLLTVVGAWYHFTKGQFAKAALLGFVAGMTRPNGCILSVPLALLALGPWLPRTLVGGRPIPAIRRDTLIKAMTVAAMPGIGMLVFSAFIWQLTGDPFAWLKAHAAWGRTYKGLATVVAERYGWISNAGFSAYVATLPYDFVNALGVLFVLACSWGVARRLGLAYAAFILINILPPIAAGGLISMGRVSSVMFPAFVWLAGATPRTHRAGWIASFAALQALVAVLFYTWRPLY